jgi:hypothetical protein
LKDVYVTDHSVVEKKYITSSEPEEEEFFNYEKSVEEYNNDIPEVKTFGKNPPKYPVGSLLQKIIDPFAGASRDENGTILYTISEKEMESKNLNDEEHLK